TIRNCGRLVEALLEHVDRLVFTPPENHQPPSLDFSGINHLAHLDYKGLLNDVQIFQLAQQCAQTLQFLRISASIGSTASYAMLSTLIRDTN
ncbi:hypothetical protein GGI18_004158, partial [Coemansia linderi]